MGLIYFERIIWITPLAQINSGVCSSLPTQVLTKAPSTSLSLAGTLEPRHPALALEKGVVVRGIGLALSAHCHVAPSRRQLVARTGELSVMVPGGDRLAQDGCVSLALPVRIKDSACQSSSQLGQNKDRWHSSQSRRQTHLGEGGS